MRHRNVFKRAHRGVTLVELMVAMVLGLLLVGAMLTLVVHNSRTSLDLERSSRQVENGRYALQRVSEDLRHAGYYGDYLAAPAASGAMPDPCTTATAANLTAMKSAMAWRVQGYADLATAPSCIPSSDFVSGSNVLVVRFAHPTTVAAANWTVLPTGYPQANRTYFQANYNDVRFATSLVTNANTAGYYSLRATRTTTDVSAPIFEYITRLYFLSPCTRFAAGATSCTSAADDGAPVQSLKMIELGSVSFSAPIAIAQGIERLEFDYGIDANNDGAPDAWSRCADAAPCTAANWANVVAVRVSVLARNAEASAGFTDTKTYDLGLVGTVGPATGYAAHKRHAYQAVVRLNNVSMNRE